MRTLLIVAVAASSGCIVQVSNLASCTDGIQNGGETDVDCGGGVCAACSDNRRCVVNSDCASGSCAIVGGARICAITQVGPTCTDNLKNGNESDVDCGGGACPACADNKTCNLGSDCLDGVCSTQRICLAPTCTDGVRNGTETGVDCGGGCPPCGHLTGSPLTGVPDPINTPKDFIKPGFQVAFTAGAPAFGISGSIGLPPPGGTGSTWTLMWIGDQSPTNQFHTFYGSIWTQGTFASITRGCAQNACTLEGDDLLSQPGGVGGGWTRIDFDSNFTQGMTPEGFTFSVTGTNFEPVYFDLYIDGVGANVAPKIWYISSNTGTATNPSASFFGWRTN
jgi:hypothetical protein